MLILRSRPQTVPQVYLLRQEGTYNIGMASRELKDTETGVTATTIAQDGIAVIVNKANPTEELTSEQVLNVYTGEITAWDELEE